ncbi:MAG TPA: T9SS type A sorting domain-containing protein [Chitinophagales bacterium]|nr:T9SS type A sorting domain-containing protein [Chitinophagales bacterium]HNA59279.1 T9SS type A sorting domain-containing protein [Chitinophagales bacterium]HNE44929.1 T9SS type A sorting domain-containing protein [Chitinophagales bacterium]HNF68029.1 T9SS type A sorting domain-containing protein [Chitinophagales bacterium]
MNRKNFLRGLSLAGVGLTLPSSSVFAKPQKNEITGGCILIPTETAGPYPLDLSENAFYFRNDVREIQTGTQLNLKIKVIGNSDCMPMQNVRVNIWHCNKDGLYSGYDNASNPGQADFTYLRGYQIADANGEVNFITILPGWYNGRVCHIHFRVYVSTAYAAISQLTFDHNTVNAIYAESPDLYTKGADPLTPETDGIFADGYAYQLATLTVNPDTGGYDSYLEVTVEGQGTTGIGWQENVNAQHFSLQQNFPNPATEQTTIPFVLKTASSVQIELYDINAQKIKTIDLGDLPPGNHESQINFEALSLPKANYIYQLVVQNNAGRFTDHKLMTVAK